VGIVEWAVDATTVHRGIRTYAATGFAQFSLDQWTNAHKMEPTAVQLYAGSPCDRCRHTVPS
jgi:hypothetical protein